MLNLYQINLPLQSNTGATYAPSIARWEALALATAGGYTRLADAVGAWRDNGRDNGRDYVEPMAGYQITCKPDIFDGLVRLAFHHFPDQAAIFTAHIGQANIIDRSKTP